MYNISCDEGKLGMKSLSEVITLGCLFMPNFYIEYLVEEEVD